MLGAVWYHACMGFTGRDAAIRLDLSRGELSSIGDLQIAQRAERGAPVAAMLFDMNQ